MPDLTASNMTGEQNMRLRRGYNWPLLFGLVIVGLVLVLALVGPVISPRDPMQENFLVFIDDTNFTKPPFTAFLVPGFPLGSDEYGRDVLSRVLWGLRPTLTLVLVVAALRLVMGTLLGMWAGWSSRRIGWLESLISFSISIPVLFIALLVIAALSVRMGVWAFIIGLLITGWGDTARIIREQVRVVKTQVYVEAAVSLGASSGQILYNHVLPQIMPLGWMMLAFEVSNSLLVTAELGVLGYFVNAIWIPIGDYVGIRATGAPELGQMLATMQITPWGALSAGFLIFMTILGFNLLGDGLRIFTSPEERARRSRSGVSNQLGSWFEEGLLNPSSPLRRQLPTLASITIFLGIIVFGGYFLYETQIKPAPVNTIQIPGGHLWAGQFRDAQATRWSPVKTITQPKTDWVFEYPEGFSSSPVVSASGEVYLTSPDSKLLAISPEGKLDWAASLPAPGYGPPALGPSGTVYIVDYVGGLISVQPDGTVKALIKGTNTRVAGLTNPLVNSQEIIFYTTTSSLYAVAKDGNLVWKVSLPTYSYTQPTLRITPDEKYLIFEDLAVDAEIGKLVVKDTPEPGDIIVIGANGKIYRKNQVSFEELTISPTGAEVVKVIRFDARSIAASFRVASDAGATPEGYFWMNYGANFGYSMFAWLDPSGQVLGSAEYPYFGSTASFYAFDQEDTLYICGFIDTTFSESTGECRAQRRGATAPLWRYPLVIEPVNDGSIATPTPTDSEPPRAYFPAGGALTPTRLYIVTNGALFAISNAK